VKNKAKNDKETSVRLDLKLGNMATTKVRSSARREGGKSSHEGKEGKVVGNAFMNGGMYHNNFSEM
jgi:hypothetical protein